MCDGSATSDAGLRLRRDDSDTRGCHGATGPRLGSCGLLVPPGVDRSTIKEKKSWLPPPPPTEAPAASAGSGAATLMPPAP